jgi:hypothetical protein
MIVSVADYKSQIDASEDDVFIEDCLLAAQSKIESQVGYPLEAANYEREFTYRGSRTINLGLFKVKSIDSVIIDYVQIDEAKYSLDGYFLDISSEISLHEGSTIAISFNAGFTADECPREIALAIMFIAQALSKNKGAAGYSTQANFGQGNMQFDQSKYFRFYDLVTKYRVFKL